jgi:hypothetical protein
MAVEGRFQLTDQQGHEHYEHLIDQARHQIAKARGAVPGAGQSGPHDRRPAGTSDVMDLATSYLGLLLPHPFLPGASPLTQDLDTVLRLQDAGAPAIVMHSLFEEDLVEQGVEPHEYLGAVLRSSVALTCRSSPR